ncbi:FMN-binding negative transcriptional regulator [Aurantiacibacter poecillastricola]|uniref:FMN-binding negative transcriptional regulator n=1 Tax=Aurantiacibacter poecillastricola TaxID=3064385 RepID=UPI00273D0517|nr:FMN-binding negative transcriptional regulator [Aurantiacibacter sp. 219JJ12-13]MDP5262799.1 FMN-binding negative transcriptional regulator [Aurantiacibacter sp. 219JJ12-13]
MHPNPSYHAHDRAMMEALIDQVGFGMIFLATPGGPRVAHTPLLSTGDGAIQFHLANANALTAHLVGAAPLVVVNGPDAYVSPRWYDDRATVPTWDYVALEIEGRVRRMDRDGLEGLLHTLIEKYETAIPGTSFTASETPGEVWDKLIGGITGFEMEVRDWRATVKLSQRKSAPERARIAEGMERAGHPAMARLYRETAR